MSGNTFRTGLGVCPTTPQKDMAAYDALPPMVRARLRDAPCNVASQPLLAFWRSDIGDAAGRHAALCVALDTKLGGVTA